MEKRELTKYSLKDSDQEGDDQTPLNELPKTIKHTIN
jgi:hypothetical protein